MVEYKTVVYISHPYSGKYENEVAVAEIITKLSKKYPGYLFVSPIHAFSFAYKNVDYDTGMKMCLWLLDRADEMWLFGDWEKSIGCQRERQFCMDFEIPFYDMRSEC